MSDDLFASAREDRLHERAPLAARLRPRTLDEVVGQEHLLGPGRPLRVLIEGDRLSSVVLWGPPGTGKTTIARLIAGVTAKAFEPLSAVSAGVKDVREVIAFPKTQSGADPLTGAPSALEPEQLTELGLTVRKKQTKET